MKKLCGGLALALFLLLTLVLLSPFLVDLDKYKADILVEMGKVLPREIDFQHLSFRLVPRLEVEVQGLTVADNPLFSESDWVRVEKVHLLLRFFPLLRGQLRVRKAVLYRPVIRLMRNEEGRFNFRDLAGGETGPVEGQGSSGLRNPGAGASGARQRKAGKAPVASGADLTPGHLFRVFMLGDLDVRDGRILYRDETIFSKEEHLELEGVELKIRDLSLPGASSLELGARLMGSGPEQNFSLAGQVGPVREMTQWGKTPFDLKVSLWGLPLDRLPLAWLPAGFPWRIVSGLLRLDLNAEGLGNQQLLSAGTLRIEDLALETIEDNTAFLMHGPLVLELEQESLLEFSPPRAVIQSAVVSLGRSRFSFSGSAGGLSSAPEWNLELCSQQLHLDDFLALFSGISQGRLLGLLGEGPLDLRLKSWGNSERVSWDADFVLDGAHLQYRDVFQKPGGSPLSFVCRGSKEGKRILIERLNVNQTHPGMAVSGEIWGGPDPLLGLVFESAPLSLESLSLLFPSLRPYGLEGNLLVRGSWRGTMADPLVNLQMSSERVKFLLPVPESRHRDGPAAEQPGFAEGLEMEAQWKKNSEGWMAAHGKLRAKKGEVYSLPFQGLSANLQWFPATLKVDGLELRAFGGSILAKGECRGNDRSWTVRASVRGVDLGAFMDSLTPYAGLFSGVLYGDLVLRCEPVDLMPAVVRTSGTVRVLRGEWKNLDLVAAVTEVLPGIGAFSGLLAPGPGADIGQHGGTRFACLEGSFEGELGLLRVESLQIHDFCGGGPRETGADVFLAGRIARDHSLDFQGKVVLASRHSRSLGKRAGRLKALMNPEGRIVLPFTLTGSLEKPVAVLDAESVRGTVVRGSPQRGLAGESAEPGDDDKGRRGERTTQERPMDDLLRGLIP